jgi:hypothetical protein
MAIGIHIVRVNSQSESGAFIDRVPAVVGVASSTGAPTLDAYLAAEAALGYLPLPMIADRLVTVDVSAVNNA